MNKYFFILLSTVAIATSVCFAQDASQDYNSNIPSYSPQNLPEIPTDNVIEQKDPIDITLIQINLEKTLFANQEIEMNQGDDQTINAHFFMPGSLESRPRPSGFISAKINDYAYATNWGGWNNYFHRHFPLTVTAEGPSIITAARPYWRMPTCEATKTFNIHGDHPGTSTIIFSGGFFNKTDGRYSYALRVIVK